MNDRKVWMLVLVASTLLVLLIAAGCSSSVSLNESEGQALVSRGDELLASLQAGDLASAKEMMTSDSNWLLNGAIRLAGGFVDVEDLITSITIPVKGWEFDKARLFTRSGKQMARLDGSVNYEDGSRGEVHIEFVQQDNTWMVRSFNFED